MLISELPEPYKALAESRRGKERADTNNLELAFTWKDTPEGFDFWYAIDLAEPGDELSEIPVIVDLLTACKWLVAQLQGDSGTGHSHWEQFPEYRAALAAISKSEGGQG
jgi:hypothetical protein